MSSFQWKDVDLNAGNIVIGTITSIDRDNMTAVVLSEGVSLGSMPIHYHCGDDDADDGIPFSVAYPDDLDDNGDSPFAEDDVVIVMFRKAGNQSPLIIGFPDEVRECCPSCDALVQNTCFEMTPGTPYTFGFESKTAEGCEDKPILNELSDGIGGAYTGVFDNIVYDDVAEQWKVDYTPDASLCSDPVQQYPIIGEIPLSTCFMVDDDSTPDEISPTDGGGGPGTAIVYIKGGIAPFVFSTESTGYYWNSGLSQKSITTDNRFATLYCDGVGNT